MRDLLSWNVSLGRWADVQVRLHVSFLVLIVAVLHLSTAPNDARIAVPTIAGLTVLLLSVIAHECGHCLAAWKSGGRIDHVLLAPWGGLTYLCPSRNWRVELAIALVGPAVNLAICLAATLTLVGLGAPVGANFHPFALPPLHDEMTAIDLFSLIAWINWLILLVNLLPAYPLDGARALRAVVRPRFGFRTAVVLSWRTGIFTSACLILAAWALPVSFEKAALACSLLGIFLYFSSRQEAQRLHEADAGDDEDPFGDAVDEHGRGGGIDNPLRRWFERRRRLRIAQRARQERDEESRADDILARLHTLGPQALSADDKAILQRVSERYRQRQQG
ncbi:MAG: hypothetical protein K8U03_25150 [Planctomycetia bacterium]|nr:hypothetical protein [Planctomycetia bacterium]